MTVVKTFFSPKWRIPALAFLTILLSACGATPKKTTQTAPATNQPIKQQAKIYSSDDYLLMARQNDDSPTYLLKAAQMAFNEQNYQKSLIIIKSAVQDNYPLPIRQQMLVLEAGNHLALNNLIATEQILSSMMATTDEIKYDVARLKVDLFSAQQRYVESLRQLFILEKASENREIDDSQQQIARQIWQQLNQLPNITLNSFSYDQFTNAKSWIDLVGLTRLYAGQPAMLQSQLKRWYQLRPSHVAMNVLPESFQRSLEVIPFEPKKIAVILPYSGRLRKQAQAIRNGLLVANLDKSNVELMFINSDLPMTTIEQKLKAQQVEFIIGPLHKDKVTEFAQNPVISAIPSLFLNRIELQNNPVQHHFYFGLTPEDEAKQAAIALFNQGFNRPSIIAPNNRLGQRLTDMFIKTWNAQRSDKPILVPEATFYSDQKQMQKAVADIMDVKQSKARIKKIKALVSRELKTEPRNRKDLDVIYVIGNNVQTKLLKPLIEVNTSPFTQSLPVYATSRSHVMQKPNDDKRDLRSLKFTEIPWMLETDSRYIEQRALFDKLWPAQDGALRRLFALGYDALYLVDRIAQLRVLNGLTEQGMSGRISVDPNGFINRLHQWAMYNEKGQVQPTIVD